MQEIWLKFLILNSNKNIDCNDGNVSNDMINLEIFRKLHFSNINSQIIRQLCEKSCLQVGLKGVY